MGNSTRQRPFEEQLALEVIKRVERLDPDDWEWIPQGKGTTPDLRIKKPPTVVEITSHVNSEDIQFWEAKGTFDKDQAVPGLKHKWALAISPGQRRIKDSIEPLKQVLREIEAKGGPRSDMLAEGRRRFDPDQYLHNRVPLNQWHRISETHRPPLWKWLEHHIDYWYPQEIAKAWHGGDYPTQTIDPLYCEPASNGGSIRLYKASGMGWDLFGDELKAVVQNCIDHKIDKKQLAGTQHAKWLVIVLEGSRGATEAYHQFTEPPESAGHWSQRTPGLFHDLDYQGIDEVWIVALVNGCGDTLYLRLPTPDTVPLHINIPPSTLPPR